MLAALACDTNSIKRDCIKGQKLCGLVSSEGKSNRESYRKSLISLLFSCM